MHSNQQLKPETGTRPVENHRPADKHYTAIDGHTYDNAPRWSTFSGEWYFSSAFAAHSDQCRCFSDPEFHG